MPLIDHSDNWIKTSGLSQLLHSLFGICVCCIYLIELLSVKQRILIDACSVKEDVVILILPERFFWVIKPVLSDIFSKIGLILIPACTVLKLLIQRCMNKLAGFPSSLLL